MPKASDEATERKGHLKYTQTRMSVYGKAKVGFAEPNKKSRRVFENEK